MLREIVEEQEFLEKLGKIETNLQRADNMLDGLKFILSKCQTSGTPIDKDGKIWTYATVPEAANIISIVVFYRFTSSTVYLLDIIER